MIDDAHLIKELMEAGLATQHQLEQGLDLASKEASTLYDALIRHQLVRERDVVQIASNVLNVPALDLRESPPPKEMGRHLPEELALRCQVLPLELIDDDGSGKAAMRLAMVDPIDVMAMDEVASHTGLNIRPVLVGPSDLRQALTSLYGKAEPVLVQMSNTNEDSWAALFDDGGNKNEEVARLEDSQVLSIEMRDRPPTDVFEVVDEDLYDEEGFAIPELVEGSDRTQIGGPINLDEWELDDAFSDYDDEDGEKSQPPPMPERKSEQATIIVEDVEEYEDLANQTRIGLGSRALDELDLDQYHFDESEADEENDDGGLFSDAEALSPAEFEALEQDSDISLEHSIEIALELENGDFLQEDSEPELLLHVLSDAEVSEVALEEDESVEFLLEEVAEFPADEPSAPGDKRKRKENEEAQSAQEGTPDPNSVFPKGIRAALERVKKNSPGGLQSRSATGDRNNQEKGNISALGRIAIKRVAAPISKGVIERRSDLQREPERGESKGDPATREISADLLADLARGNTPTVQQFSSNFDEAYLAEALMELLIQKGILTREEIQATIEVLKAKKE